MREVEQIKEGKVIIGYDETYTPKKINSIFKEYFENVENKNSEFKVEVDGKELTFLVKNITYLGHPHPLYTKRIQLPNNWKEKLKNKETYLIGIYNFEKTRMFVYFNKENYIKRELNNSSAHVWTNDLLKGFEDGIFQKIDIKKNEIFIIKDDRFKEFVTEKFIKKKLRNTPEIDLFENFKKKLGKKWYGINCYTEMIGSNYHNKYQPEWAGFYFEYKFEEYLNNNSKYKKICEFLKNKKIGCVDLDLKFKSGFYGDLKTHSDHSKAILGNDQKTIFSILETDKKFWYIVLNHKTIKDSCKDFEVTKFWNQSQGKENLLSYSKKMKNSVELINLEILEINEYNKKYLTEFKQGKNSNKNTRNPKIKIDSKLIHNFKIYDTRI